jgi:hypothetical protein
MKKLVLFIFLIFISFNSKALSTTNILPYSLNSVNNFGYGLLSVANNTIIYEEPDIKSPVVAHVNWTKEGFSFDDNGFFNDKTLLVFIPLCHIAGFSVTDETDNWYKIVYNQSKNLSGWVEVSQNAKFYTWLEFFNTFGRKNGLYFLKDVENFDKTLYTQPSKESFVSKDKFYYIKYIEFKIIRGNWMLVKYLDMDNTESIGWLNWRDEDNRLFVFPKFDN